MGQRCRISVPALRPLAGPLAHAVYGHPSEALSLIAITGTNGKTTISQCLARLSQALRHHRHAGRRLSRCLDGNRLYDAGSDDPDALSGAIPRPPRSGLRTGGQFHRHRGRAHERCASRCGGIHQLHRDHLDYHGSMEAYADAKEKLFHWPQLRTAIINLDDEFGRKLMRETSAMRVLGYGIGESRRDFQRCCVPRR
jgi:UDP-N-acetylmuramoyl-L-alanyl-D-glutamate--2,6-diaminopimelate ligase